MSDNNLSHTVNVDITLYQVQNMNVDQYKDKLGKIKTSVWYKNVLGEILLTTLKEKAMIFVYGTGLTKKSYWGDLVSDA